MSDYGDIIQIIPAQPGWFAVYERDSEPTFYPVVCWGRFQWIAKGSRGTESVVSAMIHEQGCGCELVAVTRDEDDFLGYSYPGDDTDWKKEAQENLRKRSCESW